MKLEKVFRENIEISDLIMTHILSFAWTMLDHGNLEQVAHLEMSIVPGQVMQIEDYLLVVMKLIRIFSRLENMASSIGQKHAMRLILRIMQKYPYCMQLQINCSACLANLASVESNRTIMLEEGCIRLVLDNMIKFIGYPAVQAEICATLANLACHDANARYIVQHGGCLSIIKAMRLHVGNVQLLTQIDLQIQAFHALASLGKSGKDILDREEFIAIAMRSVELHMKELDVVSAAWHALGSLANAGINIASHKTVLISFIFDTMRLFNTNPTFQITACFALAHVFFNHRIRE
jgi:hypothetical protein